VIDPTVMPDDLVEAIHTTLHVVTITLLVIILRMLKRFI
jgi:hypothetical protein